MGYLLFRTSARSLREYSAHHLNYGDMALLWDDWAGGVQDVLGSVPVRTLSGRDC